MAQILPACGHETARIEQAVPEQMRLRDVYHAARERIRQAGETFELRKHAQAEKRAEEGRLSALEAHDRHQRNLAAVDTARDAEKRRVRRLRHVEIQIIVANHYKMSVSRLIERKRTLDRVLPRQIAMFLVHESTSLSYPEIGRRFGGLDHTTVLHAVRKIGAMASGTCELAADVAQLRLAVAALPPLPTVAVHYVRAPTKLWPEDKLSSLLEMRDGGGAPMIWKKIAAHFERNEAAVKAAYNREIKRRGVSPSPQIAGTEA